MAASLSRKRTRDRLPSAPPTTRSARRWRPDQTLNLGTVGSSPTERTKFESHAEVERHHSFKVDRLGSIPRGLTKFAGLAQWKCACLVNRSRRFDSANRLQFAGVGQWQTATLVMWTHESESRRQLQIARVAKWQSGCLKNSDDARSNRAARAKICPWPSGFRHWSPKPARRVQLLRGMPCSPL